MQTPSFVEHRLNAAPRCSKGRIVTTGVLVRIDMSSVRNAGKQMAETQSCSFGTAAAVAPVTTLLMPLHVAANAEVLTAALVFALVGFLARM